MSNQLIIEEILKHLPGRHEQQGHSGINSSSQFSDMHGWGDVVEGMQSGRLSTDRLSSVSRNISRAMAVGKQLRAAVTAYKTGAGSGPVNEVGKPSKGDVARMIARYIKNSKYIKS